MESCHNASCMQQGPWQAPLPQSLWTLARGLLPAAAGRPAASTSRRNEAPRCWARTYRCGINFSCDAANPGGSKRVLARRHSGDVACRRSMCLILPNRSATAHIASQTFSKPPWKISSSSKALSSANCPGAQPWRRSSPSSPLSGWSRSRVSAVGENGRAGRVPGRVWRGASKRRRQVAPTPLAAALASRPPASQPTRPPPHRAGGLVVLGGLGSLTNDSTVSPLFPPYREPPPPWRCLACPPAASRAAWLVPLPPDELCCRPPSCRPGLGGLVAGGGGPVGGAVRAGNRCAPTGRRRACKLPRAPWVRWARPLAHPASLPCRPLPPLAGNRAVLLCYSDW